jgi:hypothetical protein
MLELDERDELLTNSFTTLSHRDGLHSNDTTNGHVHMDDAGRSEVLSSHPLRRSSVSSCIAKDVGEIQTTSSEDAPDCPAAIGASADATDNLDVPDHHDIDDISHTVCPSPALEHVICHKLPLVGFPRRLACRNRSTIWRVAFSAPACKSPMAIGPNSPPYSTHHTSASCASCQAKS